MHCECSLYTHPCINAYWVDFHPSTLLLEGILSFSVSVRLSVQSTKFIHNIRVVTYWSKNDHSCIMHHYMLLVGIDECYGTIDWPTFLIISVIMILILLNYACLNKNSSQLHISNFHQIRPISTIQLILNIDSFHTDILNNLSASTHYRIELKSLTCAKYTSWHSLWWYLKCDRLALTLKVTRAIVPCSHSC